MITCSPRPSAERTYSVTSSGERCAEATLASLGTPNSFKRSAAACIVCQSLLDPMRMPTSGAVFVDVIDVRESRVMENNFVATILSRGHATRQAALFRATIGQGSQKRRRIHRFHQVVIKARFP